MRVDLSHASNFGRWAKNFGHGGGHGLSFGVRSKQTIICCGLAVVLVVWQCFCCLAVAFFGLAMVLIGSIALMF